jgi:hypothetical protein
MSENETDITPMLSEVLRETLDELWSRAPELRDLSERDLVAIGTAVSKAAYRGALGGIAHHAHAVSQNGYRGDTWLRAPDGDLSIPDPWADDDDLGPEAV